MDATGSVAEKQIAIDFTPLFADVNRDGTVNILDLTSAANKFEQEIDCPADVNGDGVVNILDLTVIAGAFGYENNAPSMRVSDISEPLTKANLEKWLHEAQQINLKDPYSSAVFLCSNNSSKY